MNKMINKIEKWAGIKQDYVTEIVKKGESWCVVFLGNTFRVGVSLPRGYENQYYLLLCKHYQVKPTSVDPLNSDVRDGDAPNYEKDN